MNYQTQCFSSYRLYPFSGERYPVRTRRESLGCLGLSRVRSGKKKGRRGAGYLVGPRRGETLLGGTFRRANKRLALSRINPRARPLDSLPLSSTGWIKRKVDAKTCNKWWKPQFSCSPFQTTYIYRCTSLSQLLPALMLASKCYIEAL